MKKPRPIRAFGAGILVGILIGSAGISVAAIGYKAWSTVKNDYKLGYVTGFLAMANLARNLQPGGWIDTKYPYLPQVKAVVWTAKLDELYSKPENQKYSLASLMQLTAKDLEKQYGKAMEPNERVRQQMEARMKAIAARQKREAEEKGAGGTPPGPAAKPHADEEDLDLDMPMPEVKAPKATAPVEHRAPVDRKRKWCRCDGIDPKAARAERQAKAEEQEKQEQIQEKKEQAQKQAEKKEPPAAPSKPVPAPPAGTPPSSAK